MSFCGYRITRVTTPATSLDLVTLDQAKAALKIPLSDTSHDAVISAQITATSAAVNNFCDRIFTVQVYRDQLRNVFGRYEQPIVTRQYPIVVDDTGAALITVTDSGTVLDPATTEIYPDTGQVFRLDTNGTPIAWASPQVLVDYTAGFETIPPDVQGACLEWLSARYFLLGNDPTLRSETIPDLITQVYSNYDTTGMTAIPGGVRDWLMPYKVWTV